MDDELKQRLIESMDKVAAWTERTEGFVSEQAPLVIQEILAYGFWGNLTVFILSSFLVVLLVAGSGHCLRRAVREAKKHDFNNNDIPYFVAALLLAVCALLPFGFATESAVSLLKVILAPRLYVLETIGTWMQ